MKRPGKCLAVVAGCCLGLALSGCGGGGGGEVLSAPIAVSGFVTVPMDPAAAAGLTSKSLTVASAAVEVAAGGTVGLYLADASGQAVGSELATGTIDDFGHYTLTVPAGLSLGANLIVRATLNQYPDEPLQAQLVATIIDIDPISDFVLDQTGAAGLENVSAADVLVVRGFIERTDQATAASVTEACQDLVNQYSAVNAVSKAFGDLLDDVTADGTITIPTGTMVWTEFNPWLGTYGGSHQSARRGTATFSPGPTAIQAATSCVETAATMGYAFYTKSPDVFDAYHDFSAPPEETEGPFPSSPAQIEPDGGFTFADPVEEELHPEYGAGNRNSCGLTRSRSLGHDSWITVSQCVSQGYNLKDGVLDLTSPNGRSIDLGLQCHIKKGAVSRSEIAGPDLTPAKYALVTMGSKFEAQGSRSTKSTVSIVNVTESGENDDVSFEKTGTTAITLRRAVDDSTPPAVDIELNSESPGDDDGGSGTLDAATGLVTMAGGPQIQFSNEGAFMTYMESDLGATVGELEWGVGMKLGTGNPTIDDGTRFRVIMLRVGYGEDGSTQLQQAAQTWATYTDGDGTWMSFSGIIGTVLQSSDEMGNTLTSAVTEFAPSYVFSWTDESTGVGMFQLTVDGGGPAARGCFNEDGVGVATLWDSSLTAKATSGGSAALGVLVLIPTPIPAP